VRRISDLLRKITARAAFSWPTFWVFYALSLLGTFLGRLETDPQWWQRLIAVTVAQLAVFAVIAIGAFVERGVRDQLTRGVLAVMWFALAGITRSGVVGVVFAVMGVTDSPFYWSRLAGGLGAGLTALVLMSFVVGEARQSAGIASDLRERQEQLALNAERVSTEIDVMEDEAMTRVRARIVEALAQAGATGSPQQLERVATDIVRPLSHELAQATPTWRVPQVSTESDRVRWPEVIKQMTSGAPFLPITTVSVIALFSLSNFIVRLGLVGALVSLAVLIVVGTLVLRGANRLLAWILPGRPFFLRVILTVVTALAAGLVVGAIVGVVASSLFTPSDSFEQRIVTAVALLTPLFGLPLGLGRAVVKQLQANVDDLRATDARLSREVSRLCMHQWSTQRSLARALHGPVQAMISAASVQVSNGGNPNGIVTQLREQLSEQLDPHNVRSADVDWRETLRRVQATWQGLCEVRTDIDDQATRLLDGDAIGAEIAMEVVSEAVSNAVRHGKASGVDVTMRGEAGQLDVTIINEGLAPAGGGSGLGTTILQDCALNWRRETTDSGVSLNVSLSLSEELSTTT
jgi:gas vesicle protein